jgi:hypothetical protein
LQPGHNGFRLAARGANGELLTECVVSFELANEAQFTAQIVPPNAAITALFESEGGQVDHATLANMNPFARQHPSVFLFPLQKHDALVTALQAQRTAGSSHIIISPVPEHAMHALLTDIASKEDAARAAEEEVQASGELNESAAKVALSLTQVDPQPMEPPKEESGAAAAAVAVDMDDEDAPIAPKKQYRPILTGSRKKQTSKKDGGGAAAGASGSSTSNSSAMSASDECCLNDSLLVPQVRSALLPFQKEGVAYAVSKLGRCLIADEMGSHTRRDTHTRRQRRGGDKED